MDFKTGWNQFSLVLVILFLLLFEQIFQAFRLWVNQETCEYIQFTYKENNTNDLKLWIYCVDKISYKKTISVTENVFLV